MSTIRKKTKMGRRLGLDNHFILKGLTEGLPSEMKKLVVTSAPKNEID